MCSVTHVAFGALVGSLLRSSPAAFGVGFIGHIPLDALPHFDFKDYRLDAVISVAFIVAVFLLGGFSPMLFGALGSVLPDLENLLWKLGIIEEGRKIFPTHSGLIKHGKTTGIAGVRSEIALSVASAAVIALAAIIRGGTS
jgi:hypothetical protein